MPVSVHSDKILLLNITIIIVRVIKTVYLLGGYLTVRVSCNYVTYSE